MNNSNQSKVKTEKRKGRITSKDVVQALKDEKLGFTPQLFYFVFFVLLSLMLAYILPYSLIITVPIVIIPSWFAYNSVTSLKGIKNAEKVTFFVMYKNYFSQFFFGGYRVIIGFLKSMLAYFVSSIVGFFIFDAAVLSRSAEYQALIAQAQTATDLNALANDLMALLTGPQYSKVIFLISSISLALGSLVFIQHILKHSPKMRRNLFRKAPIPMKQFYLVDKEVRKCERKDIWGSYFSSSWFVQVIVILAMAGGITLSYFVLKEPDPFQAVTISLFIAFVLLLPLFNYISTLQTYIYFGLANKYEDKFVNMTLEFLTKFKDKIGLEESQAKELERILEEEKKNIQNSEDNNHDEK